MGLVTEWLKVRTSRNATGRMRALEPGSNRHGRASQWQDRYQTLKDSFRSEGATSGDADIEAQTTMLQEANIAASSEENRFDFDDHEDRAQLSADIAQEDSVHLVSLYFQSGQSHIVATSSSASRTTLFDPNYGEFKVDVNDVDSLLESLSNRYARPNGQHLSTVTTQRIHDVGAG